MKPRILVEGRGFLLTVVMPDLMRPLYIEPSNYWGLFHLVLNCIATFGDCCVALFCGL